MISKGVAALTGLMSGLIMAPALAQVPPAVSGQTAPSQAPKTPSSKPKNSMPTPSLVSVEPTPILPGQTVTFQWPHGATRAFVSGGTFKAQTPVVIGRPLTDTPTKTTTYGFDLWYPAVKAKPTAPKKSAAPAHSDKPAQSGAAPVTKPSATDAKTPPTSVPSKKPTSGDKEAQPALPDKPAQAGAQTNPAAPKATDTQAKPVAASLPAPLPSAGHHHVQVTVEVYEGKFPLLLSYHDPRRWRMDILDGWKRSDDVAPETGGAIVYLQPEEDSPERIAVATMPVEAISSADLMGKAINDAPTQYDVMEDVTVKDTTQCGEPAQWTFFRGMDRAQAGIPTKSMVLALVHAGRGYVISARTTLSKFDERSKLLRCLVRSFAFDSAPPSQMDKDGKVLAYGKPVKLAKGGRKEPARRASRRKSAGRKQITTPGSKAESKPVS